MCSSSREGLLSAPLSLCKGRFLEAEPVAVLTPPCHPSLSFSSPVIHFWREPRTSYKSVISGTMQGCFVFCFCLFSPVYCEGDVNRCCPGAGEMAQHSLGSKQGFSIQPLPKCSREGMSNPSTMSAWVLCLVAQPGQWPSRGFQAWHVTCGCCLGLFS